MSGTSDRIAPHERSLERQAARLLRLEDRARPRPHPRHELDRRQHDERDPVARAAAMSASSRSSASVVNRNRTEARNATRTRPAEIEPERQALAGDRERPERDQDVLRRREEQAVDDDDREQQDGRDAHRPHERPEQARRPGRDERWRRARTGRTIGGSRKAASRTNPRPRSLVSGLRRWSQLDPRRSSRLSRTSSCVAGRAARVIRDRGLAAAVHRPDRDRQGAQDEEDDRVADRLVERIAGQALREHRLEDVETERPEERDQGVRAATGDAAEDAGRDRGRDGRRDQAGRQAADPDREEPGVLAAPRPGPGAERRPGRRRPPPDRPERIGQGEAGQVGAAEEGVRRAVRVDAVDRREVAGRAEQQAQDREDERERSDRRGADEVVADLGSGP